MRNGRIKTGDNVLFGITGSGQTIGTGVYTFDDLPDRLRKQHRQVPAPSQPPPGPTTPASEATLQPIPRVAPSHRVSVRVHSVGTLPLDHDVPRETMDMCVAAAEQCLATAAYDRSQIELLLFTGMLRTRYICEPAIATLVAEQLKLNEIIESERDLKTLAFDIYAGGLGFLYGCQAAASLMQTGQIRTAMILASELEINRAYESGDDLGVQETASAVILERGDDQQTGFGQFVFHYAPDHMHDRMTEVTHRNGRPVCESRQSANLDKVYLSLIPSAVQEALQREGLSLSDVDVVLPPQISSDFDRRLAEVLGIAADRVLDVSESHVDLFTSALPYSLERAKHHAAVAPGAIGLIINVAAGIQVGCAVYRF